MIDGEQGTVWIKVGTGYRGQSLRPLFFFVIEPGKIYEYRISLWETSTVFKAGHRIRLEVSSSNFPRYARNLNTGNHLGTSADMKIAEQTIHHDARHPSVLVLPVIPR